MDLQSTTCPNCDHEIKYYLKSAGKRSNCSRCKTSITLPDAANINRAGPRLDETLGADQSDEFKRIVVKQLKSINSSLYLIAVIFCFAMFFSLIGGCIIFVSGYGTGR